MLPTSGGILILKGANLGHHRLDTPIELEVQSLDASMRIATATAAKFSIKAGDHYHDHVAVRVPPGVGKGILLSLNVDGKSTNAVAFAYAPPVLDGVLPSVASAEGER